MNDHPTGIEFEWVAISKRAVYTTATVLVLSVVAGCAWAYGVWKDVKDDERVQVGAGFVLCEGEVHVLRGDTRERLRADGNTRLLPGDTVETRRDSRALLLLADGSHLSIGTDSVVTLSENYSPGGGMQAEVRVGVGRGRIRVQTDSRPEGSSNVIETPLSSNRLAGQTAAGFSVLDGRGEEVRVSSGLVLTKTRGGDSAEVRAGEYVALNPSGKINRREILLDRPVLFDPPNGAVSTTGEDATAMINLRWARPATGSAVYYRVEIARSPFFVPQGIVFQRDRLDACDLSVTTLPNGLYFWRVMAVAASGQESEWSDAQRFTLIAAPLPAAGG